MLLIIVSEVGLLWKRKIDQKAVPAASPLHLHRIDELIVIE